MPTKQITKTKERRVFVSMDTGFVIIEEQGSLLIRSGHPRREWESERISLSPEELTKIQQYVADAARGDQAKQGEPR